MWPLRRPSADKAAPAALMASDGIRALRGTRPELGDRGHIRADSTAAPVAHGELSTEASIEPPLRRIRILAGPAQCAGGVRLRLCPPGGLPPGNHGSAGGRRLRLRRAERIEPASNPRDAGDERRPV